MRIRVLIARSLTLLVLFRLTVAAADLPPLQGAELLKTDLLAVFAHPDDETSMAATLAAYARGQQKTVAAVYCTRGEGGGNMVGTQFGPALGVLREAELRDCLADLGVRRAYFLDRPDFGYTESFWYSDEVWGHEETLGRLVRLVRALRPEVIVTMNPAPEPGQHGQHQAAAVLAVEAFDAAADPKRYPHQLTQEGLRVWRPRKLYFTDRAQGTTRIALSTPAADGRLPAAIAAAALSHHRSQGFGDVGNAPWFRRMTNQNFTLAKTVVPFEASESDLFRGLPVAGETPDRIFPTLLPKGNLALRFAPTESVARYWSWGRQQRIDHALVDFAPEVSLAREEEGLVFIEMGNRGTQGVSAGLRFQVPAGWKVEPAEVQARFSPQRGTILSMSVTPPSHARSGDTISVIASTPEGELQSAARLRLLPLIHAPRVERPPDLAVAANWESLPQFEIPSTNLWQGSTESSADSSGSFRVGHDDTAIYVEIAVRDDHVVSNIAPDDIRGHWRSDSVELCFDPNQASEHTFECYKLGIFPFDTTGQVRAARDADAAPGPIETKAPGTRVFSERRPEGYVIRAAVPLKEIAVNYPRVRKVGFNVLIYDGDKADAKVGENINQSRLAWVPFPGVQGKPDEWGRLKLD